MQNMYNVHICIYILYCCVSCKSCEDQRSREEYRIPRETQNPRPENVASVERICQAPEICLSLQVFRPPLQSWPNNAIIYLITQESTPEISHFSHKRGDPRKHSQKKTVWTSWKAKNFSGCTVIRLWHFCRSCVLASAVSTVHMEDASNHCMCLQCQRRFKRANADTVDTAIEWKNVPKISFDTHETMAKKCDLYRAPSISQLSMGLCHLIVQEITCRDADSWHPKWLREPS